MADIKIAQRRDSIAHEDREYMKTFGSKKVLFIENKVS
jgi:hypothetical protein